MLVFSILFGLAVRYRARPGVHTRLMVLTGTMLLIEAASLMMINGIIESPLVTIGIWLSPVAIAIAHDAWYQRRPPRLWLRLHRTRPAPHPHGTHRHRRMARHHLLGRWHHYPLEHTAYECVPSP
jgi:hypothetical protein